MIDLKRLRDEPEYRARHRTQARARRPDRRGARGRRPRTRAACRRSRSCARAQNAASKEIGKAAPDERPAKIEAAGRLKDELAAQEKALQRGRGARCASSRCRSRTRPTRRCPTAARTTASSCKTVGRHRRRAAARPRRVRARRWASSTRARAAEASGSRFAYIMREAVLLELALVQVGDGARSSATASRRSCRRCSCASARWRRPASSRPTARRSTTSTTASCSSSARARCRSRRCTAARRSRPTSSRRATRASRRASGARPARTARTRGASSACTSSTRSRCSRTAIPTQSWDEHERILAIEEEIVGGLGLPYRVVEHRGRRSRPRRGEEVRHRGVAAVGGRVPRAHVVLELPDYSARRLGTRVQRRRRQPARAHAQRHRVRGQPHARVPVRALPGRRRRLRRARRAAPVSPASTGSSRSTAASRAGRLGPGGMPERPNGTVLKTVVCKHPRVRIPLPPPISANLRYPAAFPWPSRRPVHIGDRAPSPRGWRRAGRGRRPLRL